MRTLLYSSFASLALVVRAHADDAAPPRTQICLRTHEMENSQPSQDEKSILFVMRNGERWRNDLRDGRCNGISFEGFSWVLTGSDEVCEGGQPLMVRGHGVCVLGKFIKLPKPAPKRD
jgi:hypothetical protein